MLRAATTSWTAQKWLAGLEQKRREYSELVQKMNDPAFWSHREGRRKTLERFRELDVAILAEDRLARPVLALKELKAGDTVAMRDLRKPGALRGICRRRPA